MKNKVRLNEDRIKKMAKANGLSMCEISRRLGYSKTYLRGVFSQDNGMARMSVVNGIAKELGCLADLIIIEEEPEKKAEAIESDFDKLVAVQERIATALEKILEKL